MKKARLSRGLLLSVIGILAAVVSGCNAFGPQHPVDFTFDTASGEAPLVVDFAPVADDAVGYRWDFGDGAQSTGVAPSHVYYAAGTYSVELTIEFEDGTTRSATKPDSIVVTPGPAFKEADGLYWIDEGRRAIVRGTRDGLGTPKTIVSGFFVPIGAIAVGPSNVYFAAERRVWCAPLDGSSSARGIASYGYEQAVTDIAVDSTRGAVYWTVLPSPPGGWSQEAGGIVRADLSGGNQTVFQRYSAGSTFVAWELALDPYIGAVYWFHTPREMVPARSVWDNEIRLSLASTPMLVMTVYYIWSGTELAASVGLAHAAQYLYWTMSEYGEIMRIKADATEVTELIRGLPHPKGIAVDASKNALFWSDDEGIHRANLDGTDARLLYDVTTETIVLGS